MYRIVLWAAMLLAAQAGGGPSLAADLFVDAPGGATQTIPPSLTFENVYVGYAFTGSLNQSGGTNTVNQTLNLGYNTGSSGSYLLSDGSLKVSNGEFVGNYGRGAFTQSGGSHTVGGSGLALGFLEGSNGNYDLRAGSLTVSIGGNRGFSGGEALGYSGSGTFNQSGGTHTIIGDMGMGYDTRGTGNFILSGGSLKVAGGEAVGMVGNGVFFQSGGTHTVGGGGLNISGAEDFAVGFGVGSLGSYTLQGGSLAVSGDEYLGHSGRGTFTQSGGTHTVTGSLYLGYNSGSSGTYTLSGGSLSAVNEYIGRSGSGVFTQSGGSNMVTHELIIAVNPGSTGTYNFPGGSLTAGAVQVNPGGTLRNHPGGTMNVTGNYTQTTGGTLEVGIASAASYGKVNVGGAASLSGTVRPVVLGGYVPPANQVFPGIITAAGGVSGTFSTLANAHITPTLYWQALYNPASVDLQAKANYTFADLNLTPNQLSVGNMLNGFTDVTSGDMFEVLNAINALTTSAAVGAVYNEISPMKYSSLPTLTFGLTRMQFEGFKRRMARLRWESEFSSGSPSAGGGGLFRALNFSYDNKMLLASSSLAVSDAGTPLLRRGVDQRWGIYVEPLFNWGSQSGVPNQVGYRSFSAGFTAGVDFWIKENLLVGLNAGYSNTDTSVGGTGGNINIGTIPFNAYGSFFANGFYIDGVLGYTHNNYDMERNIALGTINRTAKATTGGNQFQLGVDGGYDIKVGNAIFGPMLSLAYANLETQAFTESNAGVLNLKVSSQSASSLQTGLGARASYRAKVGNVTVKPQVSVAWQHEYSGNTRGLNASLAQGSSNMTFRTVSNPGKNFAVVGAEVSARFSKRFVANIGYTGEVGRSNASNHMLNAGLRFEF